MTLGGDICDALSSIVGRDNKFHDIFYHYNSGNLYENGYEDGAIIARRKDKRWVVNTDYNLCLYRTAIEVEKYKSKFVNNDY